MSCISCREHPVFEALCKEHFYKQFEARVKETIKKYGLFKKKDNVLVAASGGKDSLTTLFVLKKFGYTISALAIDEGIAGYRDDSLATLKKFCKEYSIPLKIVSFKKAFGKELDVILRKKEFSPCTLCGTFRRYLMNKHAKEFDVIATGHNADDEAQAVLMNLCKANTALFPRLGPMTASGVNGFTKRVKPLYFCTEKEILTYALLRGFSGRWDECPYAHTAFRADVRDELNRYEQTHPGTKRHILEHFLQRKEEVRFGSVSTPCPSCGEPATTGVCKACRLKIAIGKK